MLDQETKRKIDSARDILVGKVPDPTAQVDQITIALIYKFMDDMDQESKEMGGKPKFFTGDFKKYSWPKIVDKKLSGQERLDLYIQAINQLPKNEKLPSLFRELFKNAFLPYRDAETLNLFLKEINGFTYDHSENLGNAFEYLLSVLGSQGDAGQFRTPRHIIDFMVEVIAPKKDESILDPACGTSGFLISSYKHIIKNNSKNYNPDIDNYSFIRNEPSASTVQIQSNGKYKGENLTPTDKRILQKNIVGYDISPKMVKLSLVNMYLHNFKKPQIYEYDTLTNTDRWENDFNVILANPPFMSPKGGIRPHNRFSVQANRAEVLFVDYIAEHLTINGRATIIVPEGIIFKSDKAYKALRRMLVEDQFLWAVVSLPAKVFEPYSGVKTSILFLDKKRAKNTNDILFVDVQNDGFDLGTTRRKIDKNDLPEAFKVLKQWSNMKKEKSNIAQWVNKKKVSDSDYNLTGKRYKINIYIHLKQFNQNFEKTLTPFSENLLKITRPYIEWAKKIQEQKKLYKTMTSGLEELATQINYLVNSSEFLKTTREIQNTVKRLQEPLQSYRTIIESLNETKKQINYMVNISETVKFEKEIQDTIKQIQNSAVIRDLKKILEIQKQLEENLQHQQKWPLVELGDICEIVRGGSPRPIQNYITQNKDGINWIKIGDVTESEKYITQTKQKIKKQGASKTRLVKPGDFILSNSMSFGRPYILKIDGAIHDGWLLIRINENKEMFPDFLYQVLRSNVVQKQYKVLATGGVVKNLNSNLVKSVKIPLPPLEVQKEIVAEIENYQKIINAAKQIVESWKPIIKIDSKWPIANLEKVTKIISGQSPESKYYNKNGEGLPFYQGKTEFTNMYIGKPTIWTNKVMRIAKKDDILMSVRAPVGPVNISTEKICIGRGLAAIRVGDKMNTKFLFYYLKSISNQIIGVGGSVFDSINQKQIKNIKVPFPPLEAQKEIVSKIEKEKTHIESCKDLIRINKEKIKEKIDEIWN